MLSPRLWNKSLFFALASPATERTRAGQASAPKLVRVVLLRLPGRVKLAKGALRGNGGSFRSGNYRPRPRPRSGSAQRPGQPERVTPADQGP